jgi:hypothetical protein
MLNRYEKRNYNTQDHKVKLRHHYDILKNFMFTACQLMQDTKISHAVPAAMLDNLVKASGWNSDTDRKGGRTNILPELSEEELWSKVFHVPAAKT